MRIHEQRRRRAWLVRHESGARDRRATISPRRADAQRATGVTTPAFSRAIVLVLDSVGIGELPDAQAYGDEGSDTLGNICRQVAIQAPALQALGLGCIAPLTGIPPAPQPEAAFGRMAERSPGKESG